MSKLTELSPYDKFLRDTALPVLDGSGAVRHESALDWANRQYDAFADRRRLAAEGDAESRYLEDLRSSAKELEAGRTKPKETRNAKTRGRGVQKAKGTRKSRGGGDE